MISPRLLLSCRGQRRQDPSSCKRSHCAVPRGDPGSARRRADNRAYGVRRPATWRSHNRQPWASGKSITVLERLRDLHGVAKRDGKTRLHVDPVQHAIPERHEPAHARIFDSRKRGCCIVLADCLDKFVNKGVARLGEKPSRRYFPPNPPKSFQPTPVSDRESRTICRGSKKPFGLSELAGNCRAGSRAPQEPQHAGQRRRAAPMHAQHNDSAAFSHVHSALGPQDAGSHVAINCAALCSYLKSLL